MMPSSAMIFLIALAAVFAENDAAPTVQNGWNDGVGNFIPSEVSSYAPVGPNCCIIPTCVDYGRCYETLSCGYICTNGRYRKARSYSFTQGYSLRDYYMKEYCDAGGCRSYKFSCNHCPSPKEYDFNIDKVGMYCKSCYYHSSY